MESKEIKIKVKKSFVLNSDDRIYSAIATVYDKPNYAVYTLGHDRSDGNYYYMFPSVNVATFSNQQDADLYHDAVQNIMTFQQTGVLVAKKIREYDTNEIANFYNKISFAMLGIKTLEKQK